MVLDRLPLPDLLAFAIERRVCVLAEYNRGEAKLAPYSLIERHGELFLRAVTLEYDGRSPRQPKLGTFKLLGLTNVRLSAESLDPISQAALADLDRAEAVDGGGTKDIAGAERG